MNNSIDEVERAQIKELLWQIHPIDCGDVGHAMINELVGGRTYFETFYGSANSDQTVAIQVLSATVPILVAIVQYLTQIRIAKISASPKEKGSNREPIIILIQNASQLDEVSKMKLISLLNETSGDTR